MHPFFKGIPTSVNRRTIRRASDWNSRQAILLLLLKEIFDGLPYGYVLMKPALRRNEIFDIGSASQLIGSRVKEIDNYCAHVRKS